MRRELSAYSDEALFQLMGSPDRRQAEAAFRELYARYAQRVYGYCARILGSRYDAQDVFQETFLRFWQSAQQERTMTNVPAFLLRIARNLCLNFKRDNRPVAELDEEVYASPTPSPVAEVERQEFSALLHRAIAQLPLEYREALVLREQLGLSYAEIATLVGASESAVKVRVFRAKEKLRQLLAPYIEELRSSGSQL
ncbi:ECF RNA polymerase sigma factor SigE [bacterium HR21]|jgi:RNA polymerase sigma-70 factor (ECF subfamily)|nr:ECF RNA polymerase sigma factor SigE [bacterium HR21]